VSAAQPATQKQVDLIITLMGRLRAFNSVSDIPETKRRAGLLTAGQAKVVISELNEKLGYAAKFSPATDAQRSYIGDLEKRIFGAFQTKPVDRLTYELADKKIKYLKAQLAASKADGRLGCAVDFFTRNVS
jgi:hypothetical protein